MEVEQVGTYTDMRRLTWRRRLVGACAGIVRRRGELGTQPHRDRSRAVVHSMTCVQALQVSADGALSKAQADRNLLVGQPVGDQPQDLVLPRTEMDHRHGGKLRSMNVRAIGRTTDLTA